MAELEELLAELAMRIVTYFESTGHTELTDAQADEACCNALDAALGVGAYHRGSDERDTEAPSTDGDRLYQLLHTSLMQRVHGLMPIAGR